MKYSTYNHGIKGVMWGIWDASCKRFVFGICEDTPRLAEARLYQKIGDDAKKWRYEAKRLPKQKEKHMKEEIERICENYTEYDAENDSRGWCDEKEIYVNGRSRCGRFHPRGGQHGRKDSRE